VKAVIIPLMDENIDASTALRNYGGDVYDRLSAARWARPVDQDAVDTLDAELQWELGEDKKWDVLFQQINKAREVGCGDRLHAAHGDWHGAAARHTSAGHVAAGRWNATAGRHTPSAHAGADDRKPTAVIRSRDDGGFVFSPCASFAALYVFRSIDCSRAAASRFFGSSCNAWLKNARASSSR
jgi:hypothetical protein